MADMNGQSINKIRLNELKRRLVERYVTFKDSGLPIKEVDKMLLDDAVSLSVNAIKLPIMSITPRVECDNKKQEEFFQGFLEHSWSTLVEKLIKSMLYGYYFEEVIYELKDGYWLPNEYRDVNLEYVKILRQDGVVVGFEDELKKIKIPAYKSFWSTWQASFQKPYGDSFLRPAYENWFYKNNIKLSMAQGYDRLGEPIVVVKYVPEPYIDDLTRESSRRDLGLERAIDIGENIHENKWIVMQATGENPQLSQGEWGIDILDTKFDGNSFEMPIKLYDNSIYRTLFMPDSLMASGNDSNGSYALSQSQSELRNEFLNGITEHFINELLETNTGMLWNMAVINFGSQAQEMNIGFNSFSDKSLMLYNDILKMVVNNPMYNLPIDTVEMLEQLEIPVIGQVKAQRLEMQSGSVERRRATERDNALDALYKKNKAGLINTYAPAMDWLVGQSGKFYDEFKGSPNNAKIELPNTIEHKIEQSFDTMILVGYLTGRKVVTDRVSKIADSRKLQNPFSDFKVMELQDLMIDDWWSYSPEEVVEIFRSRVPMTTQQYENLASYAKEEAFSLALANSEHISNVFQKSLTRAIEGGLSRGEWVKQVKEQTIPSLGLVEQNTYYLNNVYRTNMSSAFMAGNYSAYADPFVKSIFPAMVYVAIGDDRTRPDHLAQDGATYPIDHPYWDNWYPPNDYQCRCYVIEIMDNDYNGIVPPRQEFTPAFVGHVGKQWLRRIG